MSNSTPNEMHDHPLIVKPNMGETIEFNCSKIVMKLPTNFTDNEIGIYELHLQPGMVGAELHYHKHITEIFIVDEGSVTIALKNDQFIADKGSLIYIPKRCIHGFRNDSSLPVSIKLIFLPGFNREAFFRHFGAPHNQNIGDRHKILSADYDTFFS